MSLMPIQVPNIRLPATDDWSGLLKLGEGIGQAAKQYGLTKDLNAAYEGQDPAQQQGLISKLMGEEAPAAKPIDPAFAESTKLGYAAKAYAMNGEYEMAQRTQAQALAQREKEIAEIADSVMYGDDPDAVAAAYPKIRNGEKIEFEDLGNGVRRAWGVSELNPAQRRLMAEGDNKTLMDAMRKAWNPKLAMELARQEQEFALKQDESRYRGQYYKDQGENLRIDNQRQAQQLADDRLYKQITVLQNQIQRLPPDAVEERALAMQALDGLMRQYATSLAAPSDQGLRGGGQVQPVTGARVGADLGVNSSGGSLNDTTRSYAPLVQAATQGTNVPPELVMSVMQAESSGNPRAVSPAGAKGLMQFIDSTARRYGIQDPFNPEQSIRGAVGYLGDLLNRYNGDAALAVAAYNAGEERVDNYVKGNGTLPKETRNYVPKVMGIYGGLTNGQAASPSQPSPGLATNAPQQGLTATPNAPAPAQPGQTIDPRWMEASRAYQTAAKTPKPTAAKEMSVKERLEAIAAARDLLSTDPNFTKLSVQDQLTKAEKYAFGTSGAGYDAVGSIGQIANGTAKDNAGGLTGSDFATVSKAAATGVRKGVTNSALAKEQAKFDQRVQSHANSLRALQSIKASNPEEAKRQARAALADIEGLYPNLTAAGKQSAATALNGIYTLFPELAPQP